MKFFKLFSLVLLLCTLSTAALSAPLVPSPVGISLNPALNELKVEIPIRNEVYPFIRFSAAPDMKTIAVVLNSKIVPANSTLSDEAAIIDVSSGQSRLLAVVKPPEDDRFSYMQADDLQFLSDTVLRVEFTGGVAGDSNKQRQIRTYRFFDTKTKKQSSLESRLPLTEISNIRAFSKYHYLVRHIENGVKRNSVIYFDPITKKFKTLGQPNDEVAHALRQAVDEPGEDVWRLSDDIVNVHIRVQTKKSEVDFTFIMNGDDTKMLPGHFGGMLDESGMFVIGGNGSFILTDDHTIAFSKDGENTDGEWSQSEDKLLPGPFYQMDGFVITDYADAPHFGWVKLVPGQSEPQAITESEFQLVQYEVANGIIAGIGKYEPEAQDIFFYAIHAGSAPSTASPQLKPAASSRRFLEVVPFPESLPVVSTVDEHRYLFVQLNLKSIIIIDTQNPNRIAQRIALLDEDFKVLHVNDSETLLHYPKIKKVVAYERPSFRHLREMKESECEHLLKPE